MYVKIHLLLINLLIIINHDALFSQNWEFIGGPEGIYSNDIIFTRDGKLISATYDGIFFSDNFGETWTKKNVEHSIGVIHKITELSDGKIIGVSENGIVISEDTCCTWTIVNGWAGLHYHKAGYILESPVDSSIFLGREKQFYKSSNQGRDWEEIWNGYHIDGFAIDNYGTIFLGVRPGYIIKSTDNGASFQRIKVHQSDYDGIISHVYADGLGGVYFMSTVEYPTSIYHYNSLGLKSIIGGWLNPPLGVTNDGKLIYKSSNCIRLYDPITQQSITKSCQYFVRDQLSREIITYGDVWIGNFESESLFRSLDAGRTWKDIHTGHGYKPVLSIEISKSGIIFAGTYGSSFWGGLFKSDDNGKTWIRIKKESIDAYFIDISTLSNGRIIAMGSYGAYVSDDGGNSWSKKSGISLAYSQYVSHKGTIFVGNDLYGIYVSRDNGDSWHPANSGIQHSYFFNFGESSTGKIFASAWPSGTYYSEDDGYSWKWINDHLVSNTRIYCMSFRNDTLFAGTSYGLIMSVDDGITWERVQGLYGIVQEISIAPTGDIIIYLRNSGMLVSKDKGKNWSEFSDGLNVKRIYGLKFDSLGRLFVNTESGIYCTNRYLNRPITVSAFSLSQNYPNPFNIETVIKFDIAQNSHVKMSVFNVLGEKVEDLIDEDFSPGTYRYKWNARDYPSGLYFIQLKSNSFTKTIKALLVK